MPDLETLCRVSTKGKHADQASPDGNAPLSPLRGTSTRRGKSTRRSALGLISSSRHRAAKTSPSGGGPVGRRGAFPMGEGRLYGFSLALWGGFEGFIIRGAFLMTMRPPSGRNVCCPTARGRKGGTKYQKEAGRKETIS